jgi:tripartite-type tricarboxylate transporter receptor subunit TctC
MKAVFAVAAFAIAASLAPTGASAFPDGPVEVIVPSGPGSGMDILARTIATHLEQKLGQPFPVVNTPGAGQATATRALLDAAPDGQTIMIAHPQLLVSAETGILPPEMLDRIVPLAQTGRMENFLAAPANAPFANLEELAAYAKAHPSEINAAIDGIVGLDHIVLLQLADEMGVKFNYVNIPGGGPPKVQSLLGGFSGLAVLGPGPFAGVYRSGDVKALATLTDTDDKSPSFPEVPTTKAQGYSAEFVLSWWWFARADTPPDVLAALSDAIAAVMADPAAQKEIVERGIPDPSYADASASVEQIASQREAIAKVVAEVAQKQ